MDTIIILSIIGLWLIYAILIKLTRKRKYDYSFIVAFVFLLGFGYFYFIGDQDTMIYTVYSYVLPGLFAFWLIIDNVILLFKKNVSEFDFYDLEKELEHVSSASELLRLRFISTIELLHDGISFYDGETFFGTDRYIEIMGIKDNEFSLETFHDLFVKEDLVQYNIQLEKLSKRYPTYTIKYRIKKDDNLVWIIERGKMFYVNKKMQYISIVKPMDVKLYPETDVDVLNTLPNYKEMLSEMQLLARKKLPYHLVLIQLTNVPKINEKYGRDLGDLLMGEYLSKLRYKFIKDNQSLFRISGIKFGLLIKDKSKFDLLDRALVGAGELLTLQMNFGGITQTIYPNIGISESPYESKNPDLVFSEATEALEFTLKENSDKSYSFYGRK